MHLILGIETSCDETAVALARAHADGKCEVVASLVSSQTRLHEPLGGIVPDLAARAHVRNLPVLVAELKKQTQLEWSDLGAIAATAGPGLAPCLLIGHTFARTLGLALGKPVWSLNHLEGHLLSPWLATGGAPEYPFVGLIVSGGHTLLIHATAPGEYERLGGTVDDAAGEAFDKIARLLDLPYPGGPHLERCAHEGKGDAAAHAFPQAFPAGGDLNFSFSGLKTAVRYFLEKNPEAVTDAKRRADVCASVQAAIVGALTRKTLEACAQTGVRVLSVSGGVACNSELRRALEAKCRKAGVALRMAPAELCTDNAAMIAFAATHRQAAGLAVQARADINPSWPLAAGTSANRVAMRRDRVKQKRA